jgi:hypothetical protein
MEREFLLLSARMVVEEVWVLLNWGQIGGDEEGAGVLKLP